MILVDSENIAIFADAVSLSDTGAIGKGWVCGIYTTQNATLLDVAAPMPWIGGAWKWENGGWVAHNQNAIDAEIARIAEVERKAKTPQSIEAWKAREMLEVMGLTTQIETTLSALDPLVAARYKAFTVFERNDALIVMLASQLGFTDAQTDSMFIVANQITSASTRADIEALLRAEGLME